MKKEIIRLLKEGLEYANLEAWTGVYDACEAVIKTLEDEHDDF